MLRSVLVGSALATSAILLAPVIGGSVAVDDVLSARTVSDGVSAITIVDESPSDSTAFVEMRQRATSSSSTGSSSDDDTDSSASDSPAPSESGDAGSGSTEAGGASTGGASTGGSSSGGASTGGSNGTGSGSAGGSTGGTSGGSTGGTSSASGGTTAPSQPKPSGPAPAPAPTTSAPSPTPTPTPTKPACAGMPGGSTPGAPSRTSAGGVAGTTSADLASFAQRFNEIRVANCLPPVPFSNIRYDSCMEDRLFWMAEDPSTDPMSAWGHMGSVRSDGVPSVGCDGNLAGGSNNSGATVAQKWWDSSGHRASLYKPTYTGSTAGVCILFAMTHGGVPNEPYSFTRAAARWVNC
ncbi:hypothetical protein [Microcella alkalica]|uniref:hypothetical protein n=1 Tax=Microcella alkalica TaxID=355930 RepID=UPI001B7CFD24|nr:hypothetical protein [Microcella alkalica]